MKSGYKLPTQLTSSVTFNEKTFLSSYTLNPGWNSFHLLEDGKLKSISNLFQKRASLGKLKLVKIKNLDEEFDGIVVSQFSSSTTNYWIQVPGVDAYPCVSLIKIRNPDYRLNFLVITQQKPEKSENA